MKKNKAFPKHFVAAGFPEGDRQIDVGTNCLSPSGERKSAKLRRNFIQLLLLGIVSLCLATGCSYQKDELAAGVITYVDLEGGFYGIVDEAGNRYLPVDIPAEFKQDQLRVSFRAVPIRDQIGIQMWGIPVRLESIKRRE